MFDFTKEPELNWEKWNFDSGIQRETVFTDTGGGTWTFLPQIKKKLNIRAKNSLQWSICDLNAEEYPEALLAFLTHDVRNSDDKIFAEIKHDKFIHLRGGGNWEFIHNPAEGIVIQQKRFKAFMNCCLELLK